MLYRHSLFGTIMKAIYDWRELNRDLRYLRFWANGVSNIDCVLSPIGNMATLILMEAVRIGATKLDIVVFSDYIVPSIQFICKNGSKINSKVRPRDVKAVTERILLLAGIIDKCIDNRINKCTITANLPIKILDKSYFLKITYFHPSFDTYGKAAQDTLNLFLNVDHGENIQEKPERAIIEIFNHDVFDLYKKETPP